MPLPTQSKDKQRNSDCESIEFMKRKYILGMEKRKRRLTSMIELGIKYEVRKHGSQQTNVEGDKKTD